MSRAANDLEFFPRRRSGFEDAGFAVEQFSQVITGDCFVHSKHTSHLFLMLDFDPQSPDHTSVTFTEPLLCADIKSLSRSQNNFFLRSSHGNGSSCSGSPRFQRRLVNCRGRFVLASRGPNRWRWTEFFTRQPCAFEETCRAPPLGDRQFTGWPGEDFAINLETNMKWST